MKKIISLAISALLIVAFVTASAITVSAGESKYSITGQTSSITSSITANGTDTGVTHTQVILPSGSKYNSFSTNTIVNIFEVSPSNTNVSFAAINCGTYNYSLTSLGNAVLKYNETHTDSSVIAAVNADPWFLYHKDYDCDGNSSSGDEVKHYTITRSLLIIDGEIWNTTQVNAENQLDATGGEYGTPCQPSPIFAVNADGTYMIGRPTTTVTLYKGAKNVITTADGINRLPANNTIMVYNHRTGSESPAYTDAYEIYVKVNDSAFAVNKKVSGTVTAIYESGEGDRPAIDENTIVISARGSRIDDIKDKYAVGNTLKVHVEIGADAYDGNQVSNWSTVTQAIGGFFSQIEKGELTGSSSSSGAYPCPLIGLKKDGTAVMITISSDTDSTDTIIRHGIVGTKIKNLCEELGLYTALMFDGGGSTTTLTYSESEGAYVRHGGYVDRNAAVRPVANGLAIVLKNADFTGTNNQSGSIHYLTDNSTTEPLTETFVGVINNINGVGPDGTTGTNFSQVLYSNHATGVRSADMPITLSDMSFTISGWFASNNGQADELKWSIDGGNKWVGTLKNVNWSDGNDAHKAAIEGNGIANVDLTHVLFTGATIDLSGYDGRLLNITIGRTTSWGDTEAFATINNVRVPGLEVSISSDPSVSFAYVGHIESINGSNFDIYGCREKEQVNGKWQITPAIVNSGIQLSGDDNTISISGWSVMRGGISKFVWSIDKYNWYDCTGDFSPATGDKLTEIKGIATDNYGVTYTGTKNETAVYENLTADLSYFVKNKDGETVTVYFAMVSAFSGYTTKAFHFLTIENVQLGCTHRPNIENATCTQDKICTECGAVLEKAHHTEQILEAVEPTCKDTGLTEGKICSVCKEVLVKQEIVEKISHTEQIVSGVDANCTESGLTDGKICSVCKEVLAEQEEIPALGHKEKEIPGKEATCGKPGWTSGVQCERCLTVLEKQVEIPATGKHTEETIKGIEATCTEDGLTDGIKCSVCEEILKEQTAIEKIGHKFTNYKYNNDATCGVDGTKTASCDRGCTETDTITAEGTALEHKWSEKYSRDENNHWKTCEYNCGATTGNEAHDVTSGVCVCGYGCQHENVEDIAEIPATCTQEGKTAGKKCTVCGTITEGCTLIAKADHDFAEYVYNNDATCTDNGTQTATCKNCPATDTIAKENSKLGHDWKDATCTTAKTCDRCNITEGEALGHKFGEYVYNNDATCTSDGTQTAKCDNCDQTDTIVKENSKLGHDWKDATCTTAKTCDRCNITEGEANGHTEEIIPGKSATCTETGLTDGKKCSVCGEILEEQEEIAMTSHVYDSDTDATCNVCGATREIPTTAPVEDETQGKTDDEANTSVPSASEEEKSGCGSTLGFGLVGIATAIAAGYVLSKKKD